MAEQPRPDALAPIYARLAYLEGRERRRRIPRRLLPLALVALLVTLLPLSILAAPPSPI